MRFVVLVGVSVAGCGFETDATVDAMGGGDAPPDAVVTDALPDVPEPGSITISPPAIDYGLIRVGELAGRSIVVRNPSPNPLPLDRITISGSGFSLGTNCGGTLPAGSECRISAEITADALAGYAGTVTVISSGITRTVPLSATGAWELSVRPPDHGGGSIASTPAGISCPGTCAALFPGDVELEATPDPGWTVRAWSLPACTRLRCAVPAVLDGDLVTAWFQPGRWIEVTREGSGTVTSSPAAIDCGSTCSQIFTGEVTLTARPYVGQTFEGWSRLACGTSRTCVIPADSGSVDITARFSATPTSNLDLELAGDAGGEVVVYHDGARVGRCTASCSLSVPAGPLVIAAATPHRLESLSGTGCVQDGDRCELTPPGAAQITATFRRDPKDRWTFFGKPSERFAVGAFDAAGNLIAGSQQRLIKLGPTGRLRWERATVAAEIRVAPSGMIYVGEARGTVKLDPDGNELWVRPGRPHALDSAGNVLVVDDSMRMTLYQPDGTAIWNAPGAGVGIDGAGVIYEPFIERVYDEGQGHYHLVLHLHRYDAAGAPLPDMGTWGGVEEWGDYQLAVTPNRLAVVERDQWNGDSTLKLQVLDLATNQPTHQLEVGRFGAPVARMISFITGAGDDLGFAHEPDQFVVSSFVGYGYQLDRLRVDGSTWTLLRFSPASDTHDAYHGPLLAGVAGGVGGELAMLGAYQRFREWNEPAATVGLIQAFAP